MLYQLQEIDKSLFLFLNSLNSPFFDSLMWLVSGQIIWIPYFLLIIFFFAKKYNKKFFIPLLFLLITIAIADLSSVHLFKEVFKRLRPCHNPEFIDIIHIVKNKCGGNYGFVSSHSANFFSLAFFASLVIKKRWFSFMAFSIAVLIAYSRIYLGVHYPADVLGGAILGIFVAFVVFKIYLLILNLNSKTKKQE
ncbi:MAG: phosphatase PAP2 family protein [Bacteroidota bacterium]|nr:phosphatase PAP2 family protein [Bacteroidota bacterium]